MKPGSLGLLPNPPRAYALGYPISPSGLRKKIPEVKAELFYSTFTG